MNELLHYDHYVPAADVATVAFCMINWILSSTTYTKKQQNLKLFHIANGMVGLASLVSLTFHTILLHHIQVPVWIVQILHTLIYSFLGLTYIAYFHYIANIVGLEKKKKLYLSLTVGTAFILFFIVECLSPVTKFGFYLSEGFQINQRYFLEPFRFLYIFDSVFVVLFITKYRSKFVTKMFNCIVFTTGVSYLLIIVQDFFRQTSFTCLTFIIPIETVLFLYHYSSFDVVTGSLDSQAFDSYITDLDGREITLIFLTLEKFDMSQVPASLSEFFYHFNEQYFINCVTFRVASNQMALIYRNDQNPHGQDKMEEMLQDFRELYEKFQIDYKVVIIKSDIRVKDGKTYVNLCQYVQSKMDMNSILYCSESDLNKFFYNTDIVDGLLNINVKHDLDDPRVLVYCQPVLNTKTKQYRTAEALMRLSLEDEGMVFPDVFIPLAEKFELIHTLSLIILNKTCKMVRELLNQNYEIDRISINFSIAEIKYKNFCKDIIDIIKANDVPFEKIAIELTESRNDADYVIMKNVVNTLKEYGIKIYLDDFGIGYSNTSRILEVPFDVIKFDRSLTVASSKSETSRYMVAQFADIFKNTKYQVLFEGVENISDERRCIEMKADMLQGYAYSKPIPIEDLKKFLVKNS